MDEKNTKKRQKDMYTDDIMFSSSKLRSPICMVAEEVIYFEWTISEKR